jgi:hypothetical protein
LLEEFDARANRRFYLVENRWNADDPHMNFIFTVAVQTPP